MSEGKEEKPDAKRSMNILIMGLEAALAHEPVNRTYVISIPYSLDSFNQGFDLLSNPLYHIHRYRFDDVEPPGKSGVRRAGVLFTEGMAREIIEDFSQGRVGSIDLLVHCKNGKNRSPSVAMVLNELFELGADTGALKQKYPYYNKWVYEVMMKVGKRE